MAFGSQRTYRAGAKVRLMFPEIQPSSGELREIPAEVVRVSQPRSAAQRTVGVRFGDVELANLLLIELLRAKIRSNSAALDIVQALAPGAQVEEVAQAICRTVERVLNAEKVILFLGDAQQGMLRARVHAAGHLREFRVSVGQGLVGQVAEAGKASCVEAVRGDPRFRPRLERYFDRNARSVLCVPFGPEKGIAPGVLVVMNKRRRCFGREDEQLGAVLADQISVVLRLARLFEDISNIRNYNDVILQSIAAGVFTFDKMGKLVTANRAGAELLGSASRPETGTSYSSLFDRVTNPRLHSVLADSLSKQRSRTAYDVRFLRRDGASFSLNLNVFPLKDVKGNFLGVVLVTDDITQEHRLMSTLSRYVAREVAEQALENKETVKLGGTRTNVTILLADIRNFTSLSEQMPPEQVVDLLNTYYPRIINAVFRHHGMLDKFIGDAVLAVFGLPVSQEDDALRAVRAALEIRREVSALNRERARKRQVAIEIGIGISSGDVISGNIGSERRMDYTVIGDPVNVAARLEDLSKELGHKILVSDSVRAAVEKEIPCEPLGLFKVKGKQEDVPVFAVKVPD